MVPMDWPTAASTADRLVDPARWRGSSRLSTVRRDFLLDPKTRLTEQERSLMTAMLHDLVATLANEIALAAGIPDYRASPIEMSTALVRSGLADRAALISLMLRRADEYRASLALAKRERLPMLPRLISDGDPAIAAAAMAVVIARGRRRDGFGQPRLEIHDLEVEDAGALAQAVAALIAEEPAGNHGFSAAALRVVAGRDASEALDEVTDRLVHALEKAGRDPDDVAEQAASDGEIGLLAHLLARRAGIALEVAWDHLLGVGEGGLALLARMAGLLRPVAARVIAEVAADQGTTALVDEMAHFDALDEGQVGRVRDYWQLPRDFREAQDQLRG